MGIRAPSLALPAAEGDNSTKVPAADLTHITLVLDRSGSMDEFRDDAIGGFNAFVEQQRAAPGKATLTFVQFDHEYTTVYHAQPIADVPRLDRDHYIPRGQTALYDAVGRSVAETAEHIAKLPEDERPTRVVVAILTDGHENASKEYSYDRVRAILAEKATAAGWHVLFLASAMDVAASAVRMGVPESHTTTFEPSRRGTRDAFGHVSRVVTSMRTSTPPAPPDDSDPKKKPN
jgi:hypothetical protein